MEVRVRMYRQGLGDCFLLSFGAGEEARQVLVDCGSLGSTTTGVKMKRVAEDIVAATGPERRLDLLVATHEHKDHVSGFRDQKEIFEQLDVRNVWLAWTEDATDELARELQKHQGDLIEAVHLAALALDRSDVGEEEREEVAALAEGMRQVLGFFGEPSAGGDILLGSSDLAKTVQEAMAWVTKKGRPPRFLRPGGPPLEPEWLPGVRFYVLGPPRDRTALSQLGDHGDPELYHLAASQARDLRAGAPFFASGQPMEEFWAAGTADERQQLERLLPFDPRHRLDAVDETTRERFTAYYQPADGWRRIDHDWLAGAAELALQLDNVTNNTSLALAIELIDSGDVLLFPADAQVGNWLSWHAEGMEWTVPDGAGGERTVTAADLLARTVLYKVGHHASHNATVTDKGLELMTHPGLVAMIPVDRRVAMNKHPEWNMPARALYKRLLEKAQGRVVRSDVGWASRAEADFAGLASDAQWNEWEEAQEGAAVVVGELFVEWRH